MLVAHLLAIPNLEHTLKGINGIITTTKVKHIDCAISKEGVVSFACFYLIWAHYMVYYLYAKFQPISISICVSNLKILQNFTKIRKGQKTVPMIKCFILPAIISIVIQIT